MNNSTADWAKMAWNKVIVPNEINKKCFSCEIVTTLKRENPSITQTVYLPSEAH
jgi:hypothetical protein